MSNSLMVEYTEISPNQSGKRTHAIDRITPHCVVGQCDVETLGRMFSYSSTRASSNYGIGKDGRVAMFVPEDSRSWCSSSNSNDQRAVTIECASDNQDPYAFNNAVYSKLITLCADICHRNGKNKLLWIEDRDAALAYQPAEDEMLLTVHRWFANKSCPGDWMYSRMGELASKVTEALSGSSTTLPPVPPSQTTEDGFSVSRLATIQRGSVGSQVRAMQYLLIGHGYSCGAAKQAAISQADGDAGQYTIRAVKKFQTDRKITADGICGPITWAKLLGAGGD